MIIDNPTISGSALLSGSLTITGPLNVSGSISGLASNAVSASYALISTSASYALVATSASQANNADTATSASYALVATSASYALVATSASYALVATSASYALAATSASFALNATTSSYALNATTSSYALVATSASYSNNSTSASYALNATTSSFALNATSASQANNANTATSASYALNATTSSFALNATTSSFALAATSASYSTTAATASFADTFTVAGTLTAQKLVVQTITSSIVYSSGSNVFGNSTSNTQSMTGSVGISGSLSTVGTATFSGGVTISNATAGQLTITGGSVQNGILLNATGSAPQYYIGAGNNLLVGGDRGILLGYNVSNSTAAIFFNSISNDIIFGATPSTERMRILSGGNVGIGTSSPETLLHVNSSNAGGEGGYIYLDNPAASTLNNKSGIKFGTSSGASFSTTPTGEITNIVTNAGDGASALTFGTFNGSSSGERMRITSGGNVGIGTTAPTGQLSLKNQISNGSTPVASYAATNGVDGQNFLNGYYAINTDGFGTYPRYLDIVSVGSPDGSNGGSNIRLFTNPIANSSPAVERMRITSGGNVGIGTTSALQTLTLAGTQMMYNTGGDGVTNVVLGSITSQVRNYGTGIATSSFASIQFATDPTTWYRGDIRFLTNGSDGTSTSGTERMRISSAGVVTKPYQPFAMGGLASNQSISLNTFTTLAFQTNQGFYGVNTGSCWNNSTYTFTAPVTGVYMVNVSIMTDCVGQVALFVNGVRKHSIPSWLGASSTVWGGSALIPLTAGEALTLQGYGIAGTVTSNQYHTWFGIYLLG